MGIDPSLNSTGICYSSYDPDENKEYDMKFGIIHCNKLTKKEKIAEEKYKEIFQYYVFEDIPKEIAKKLSPSEFEYAKTIKLRNLIYELKNIISKLLYNCNYNRIYICIEGISYGSTRTTKSIFDLAGLNYMIRFMLLELLKNQVTLIVSPPSNVKKFATGKGNANKEAMIESFKIAFPEIELPKIDDIGDAFFMKEIAKKVAKEEYD